MRLCENPGIADTLRNRERGVLVGEHKNPNLSSCLPLWKRLSALAVYYIHCMVFLWFFLVTIRLIYGRFLCLLKIHEVRLKDGWSIYRIAKHLGQPYYTIKNEIKRGTILLYKGKIQRY